MANQITDNRTLLDSANTTTNFVGSTSPSQDTEIFIYDGGGTGASVAEQITNSRRWVMYDAGSAQNWSNNHFFIWINCGIVGLLDTKANGGFRIRFAGASTADFFEVNVGGSDDWPNAIAGGWVQFVVDIEAASASPDATGGTPPATTAIRHVGYSAVTGGTMTRAADNTWMDALWRLADGNPGIIVEGRNGGSTPWSFADILTQLGQESGAIKAGPAGSFILNCPLQIGINDTTIHEFEDSNVTVFWDNQEFAAADLYSFSALGNSGGTTNITLGIKTGTGDAATGSQGVTFQAAATGVRFDLDLDDPDLDSIGLYGCNFIHAGDMQVDDAAVELIGCTLLDCTSMTLGGGLLQRCAIVDANTADGVAFIDASDPSRIKFCSFAFSDGHAIEITSAAGSPYTFSGNTFSGYGADATTDAAILVDALTLTLSIAGGGDTPTVREINSANVTVQNNISVTFTGLRDNTEIAVYNNSTGALISQAEPATDGTTDDRSFTFSASAGTVVFITVFNLDYTLPPRNRINNFTVPSTDTSIPLTQVTDRNYSAT